MFDQIFSEKLPDASHFGENQNAAFAQMKNVRMLIHAFVAKLIGCMPAL